MLGHWAPGSDMPDHYDRAYCAAELRLRDSVLARVADGWAPARAFEIPKTTNEPEAPLESSSADETSETPSGCLGERRRGNISDLADVVLTPTQPVGPPGGNGEKLRPRRQM